MKKKVLILSSDQFGYLTDAFKYCQYAADQFDITYVGWDYGKPKLLLANIQVIYVPRCSSLVTRNIKLLKAFQQEIKKGYQVVFAVYFRGISLLKILNTDQNFIVDVRTLSVNRSFKTRLIYNLVLRLEVSLFKKVSVISEGIGLKLGLKKFLILPLGGECFCTKEKDFERLQLLYVGTLQGRNILDCVKGFHLYLKNKDSSWPQANFTIIGDSPGHELLEIKNYIHENQLSESVSALGAIPQSQLSPYFEMSNIGVSYIPIRSYYQYQPPSKTFEYLVSGMPVIATNTFENNKVVSHRSGVLIQDSIVSFYEGIRSLSLVRKDFNSSILKQEYLQFRWDYIVKNSFSSILLAE